MATLRPKLKLVGEDGNAFSILARAKTVARKAGWDQESVDKFMKEAMSGDYYHLLAVCNKYFDVR